MKAIAVPLLLLALVQAQAPKPKEIEEFKKRAKVEPYIQESVPRVKVTVDETVLYDRPGKNARVEVESNTRLGGQLFVSVRVEGQEVARYWVRSLAKPVKFPPTLIPDPQGASTSTSSQSVNGKTACRIELGGATVYDGPGLEVTPEVVGKAPKQWYSIRVDDEIVYYVPAGKEVRPKKEEAAPRVAAEQKEPSKPASPPAQEPLAESVAKVLKRLNEIRVAAGLPAVKEDPKLSEGCQLHAEYIRQNPKEEGPRAHSEDPNLPGYSEAGKKSAGRSVVSRANSESEAERRVNNLMSTFYHRLQLLDPTLSTVGIGIATFERKGKVVVIDCDNINSNAEGTIPVIFPPDGQENVPLTFALGGIEQPDPRPDIRHLAGYPITIAWSELGWQPGEARGLLESGGTPIDSWVFCRENEALEAYKRPRVVCILPKKPLLPNTRYIVTVKCKQYGIEKTPEWSKTWSFTTGKGDDEPRK